jgi:ribonuclease P protein component
LREDDRPAAGTHARASALRRLKTRAEFQRVSRGHRRSTPGFALQAARRADGDAESAGVGFTATRKIGNAVVRNRIRRRLKAALRDAAPLEARADHDYVVLARRDALTRGFAALVGDLRDAFSALASGERAKERQGGREERRRGPRTPDGRKRDPLPRDGGRSDSEDRRP